MQWALPITLATGRAQPPVTTTKAAPADSVQKASMKISEWKSWCDIDELIEMTISHKRHLETIMYIYVLMLSFPQQSLLMFFTRAGVHHLLVLLKELQRKCECLSLCVTLMLSLNSSVHFFSKSRAPISLFPDCGPTVLPSEKQNNIILIFTHVRLTANLFEIPLPHPEANTYSCPAVFLSLMSR